MLSIQGSTSADHSPFSSGLCVCVCVCVEGGKATGEAEDPEVKTDGGLSVATIMLTLFVVGGGRECVCVCLCVCCVCMCVQLHFGVCIHSCSSV